MLYASVSTLSSSSNSPETVLAQVETTLRNQLGVGHYVTIFYGVLDLRTRVLHFVNAGHLPPILRRQNGSIESLDPTRPVLGFMLDADFHSESLALFDGDRLLLYTDGVSEAANDSGEEYGPERLTKWIAGAQDETLQQRYAKIMSDVGKHAAGKFADDATLLLISVNDRTHSAATQPAAQMQNSA
jgi:sigma-B regulation protein RsbU (phosphoserine phosphatase)